MQCGTPPPLITRIGLAVLVVAGTLLMVTAPPAAATQQPPATVIVDDTTSVDEQQSPASTVVPTPDSTPPATDPDAPEEPDDVDDGTGTGSGESGAGDPDDAEETRPAASPTVRDSGIPVGSVLIAALVLLAVAVAATAASRRPPGAATAAERRVGADRTTAVDDLTDPDPDPDASALLAFLLELGEALIDAGDAVGHVESMLRKVAAAYGIPDLRVVVLPSVLVLSWSRGGTVTTEVRTGGGGALRLDQIDDLLRLELRAEHGEISVDDGRRELARIRTSESPFPPAVNLAGYMVASVGLALILRGQWEGVAIAALLGLVIGALRIATRTQEAAYQAFWPLVAAGSASAVVFTAARVIDDLAVFPALVAPLIFFLPGALLTIGVLELATDHTVSGASRVAAGGFRLILLAVGIVAGARLVGVPSGEIGGAEDGVITALGPWVGVAIFGVGVALFYGARRRTMTWILLVLYVSYSGQVIGGLFFGSALSAFFGALAMTPVALFVARQPSGPAPLVTFLPGFWLLVPGALGLEGVTRLISDDGDIGIDVLVTTATSMVGISLGILLGLIVMRADPSRPWSAGAR